MSTDMSSVHELREWAAKCAHSADDPRISADERAQLLRMKQALLALAHEQEWLEGNSKQNDPDTGHSFSALIARKAVDRR